MKYYINFIKDLLATFNKNTFDTTKFIKNWLDVNFVLDYNQNIETNAVLLKDIIDIRYNDFTEQEIRKILLNAHTQLTIYKIINEYKEKCIYEIAKIIKSFNNIKSVILIVGIPLMPTINEINKLDTLKEKSICLLDKLSYYKQLNYINLYDEIFKIEKLIIDSTGVNPVHGVYKYKYITIPRINDYKLIKELNNE